MVFQDPNSSQSQTRVKLNQKTTGAGDHRTRGQREGIYGSHVFEEKWSLFLKHVVFFQHHPCCMYHRSFCTLYISFVLIYMYIIMLYICVFNVDEKSHIHLNTIIINKCKQSFKSALPATIKVRKEGNECTRTNQQNVSAPHVAMSSRLMHNQTLERLAGNGSAEATLATVRMWPLWRKFHAIQSKWSITNHLRLSWSWFATASLAPWKAVCWAHVCTPPEWV